MQKEDIVKFLAVLLGNIYGACGLAGNIEAESGFRANNLENIANVRLNMSDEEYTQKVNTGEITREQFVNLKYGYGLCQWTYKTRKDNLYDFVGKYCYNNKIGFDIGNATIQLVFLLEELQKSYKKVYNAIINAKSIRESSDIVLTQFEKPAGYNTRDMLDYRYNKGMKLYNDIFKNKKVVELFDKKYRIVDNKMILTN